MNAIIFDQDCQAVLTHSQRRFKTGLQKLIKLKYWVKIN